MYKKLILFLLISNIVFGSSFTNIVNKKTSGKSAAKKNLENWNIESNMKLNLNESYYNEKWKGDGQSSLSWTLNINTIAEKNLNKNLYNKNTLDLSYGQTNSSSRDNSGHIKWNSPEKSTDNINFETLFLFNAKSDINPFVAGNLETQFNKFLKPVTLTESGGLSKSLIKEENMTLDTRLGLAARQIYNKKYEDKNNNTSQDTIYDGGTISVTDFNMNFDKKRVKYNSNLSLYKALFNSKANDVKYNWKTIVMDWKNTIKTHITEFVDISLFWQMKYNEEDGVKNLQIKQTIGAGFTYNLL